MAQKNRDWSYILERAKEPTDKMLSLRVNSRIREEQQAGIGFPSIYAAIQAGDQAFNRRLRAIQKRVRDGSLKVSQLELVEQTHAARDVLDSPQHGLKTVLRGLWDENDISMINTHLRETTMLPAHGNEIASELVRVFVDGVAKQLQKKTPLR